MSKRKVPSPFWGRFNDDHEGYKLRRNFNPARASTLRKTRKLLRLKAMGAQG